MSICKNCNANVPEGTKFCPSCGASMLATAQAPQQQSQANKLHCPNCKSHNISISTESSVNGAVTTHHGSFSSSRVSNTHRNFWFCSDCGTKFRNIQNLEEEIKNTKLTPIILSIMGLISAIIGIYFFVNSSEALISFLFQMYGFAALLAAFLFFIVALSYSSKRKKMIQELEYLKKNCFN